jgi:hypothetical protein
MIQGCNVLRKIPGREDVKNSAAAMVKTLEKINNIEKSPGPFFINIGPAVLKNISTGFIILIFTFFAVTAIYFIAERLSLRVYGKIGESEREEIHRISSYDPSEAMKYAREKNFSEAVLYIYRASLDYFARLGVPYGKGTTNMMIYRSIEKAEARASFRNIFSIAETVLFDAHEAQEDEYKSCVKEFNVLSDMKL